MRTLSPDHARRIALTAMGFGRPRPPAGQRRDVRHLRRVLDTVDIVQLDSVNVLARAHELPFWSRLGPHDRAGRDRWLWHSRELFDGWIHVASLTAVEVWPLLHFRRAAARPPEDPAYVARVRDEVTRRGPTSVRDLSDPGRRTGPWWGIPKGRAALERLFFRGELAIDHRTPSFLTVFDLTERVLPADVLAVEPPPRREAIDRLLLRAARAHGIGTAADLADHHRLQVSEVRPRLAALAEADRLEEVRVRGWGAEPVYRHPEATSARRFPARTLLSPFDPLVWRRERAERLYDFRYRIEIYVPEAQRVHGYYVLPFLLGERLAARVDLKADRRTGRLLVRGAFAEPDVDRTHVARELAAELTELAAWLEVPGIVVDDRGDLAEALQRAID
ncbi:winged helix-turn-helix domain-containing protein [Egicoccus halophilus]|uniref:Winged helix-turn-helix domain-containing protein n=1 Tax=Egicoccus halophilus TaxID=1670830 RepID=A0A8J3AC19_9ACTN|nr:crosslink repair DNA glycosylase YcaQ family protein [Egicoccus halophilus]GGI08014.1 hypothetical protein GCM10011354_26960 [Egicoccus halophilus]